MILVVGATGSLGGRIARGLLERGEDVRVFVRRNSPSEQMAQQGLAHTVQSLIDAGAQPAWGDLKDKASIEAAVAGVDTVISTANAVKRGGDDTLDTVDLQGTQDLIDAALLGPNEIRTNGTVYQRSGTLASIPQTPAFSTFGSTFARTIDIVLPYDPPDGWIFRWFVRTSSGYTTIERAGKETQLRIIQVGSNDVNALKTIGWQLIKL